MGIGTLLFGNLVSLACIVGAIVLALNDKSGWGWFVFGAIILHVSFKYSSDKEE